MAFDEEKKETRKAADYLTIAADFEPTYQTGWQGVKGKVLKLATQMEGLGVTIKTNSILRNCGYGLILELKGMGVKVGADLKLVDIPETMKIDAMLLAPFKPDFLTIMCNASVKAMQWVKDALRNEGIEVLGVTVLTSIDDEECQGVFGCTAPAGVIRFARLASAAGIDGLVLSPKELPIITARQREYGEFKNLSLNPAGIRPADKKVEADDQKRVGTPTHAILNGARRVIIGRPITQAPNPREAAQQILEEIQRALDAKKLEDTKKK